MVVDGATALHIAADNGNLDVGTLEHPWLLMSSILLRRCIYDTFINFMQTMYFIHAAKYHLTDVPVTHQFYVWNVSVGRCVIASIYHTQIKVYHL